MQNHLISSKTQFWITIFFTYPLFLKNRRFWPPDNIFWWKNSVLQVSGRNTLENAYKITSKSKFSTPKRANSVPPAPCLKLQSAMVMFSAHSVRHTQHRHAWSDRCALAPDCYLRQGAGGMKIARLGSRTWFLRWFYKRSQAYFGQKLEHSFSIKNRCLDVNKDDFWEKCVP